MYTYTETFRKKRVQKDEMNAEHLVDLSIQLARVISVMLLYCFHHHLSWWFFFHAASLQKP